jgi:hypothetical protein
MPSVATGRDAPNKNMLAIGVSGDGDTGAIGIGQFVHLMRRNLPLIYIIEDNGCYGLTKGSSRRRPISDRRAKNGVVNDLPPIDTARWPSSWARRSSARSFSGDKTAAAVGAQGRHLASRHVDDRRHLAVRHVQRPRRLDEELLVREGSRGAARRDQLRAVFPGHQRRLRAGLDRRR